MLLESVALELFPIDLSGLSYDILELVQQFLKSTVFKYLKFEI